MVMAFCVRPGQTPNGNSLPIASVEKLKQSKQLTRVDLDLKDDVLGTGQIANT
jgi:hypothetical protein